jgi:xanthine dehydrogenase large subunit
MNNIDSVSHTTGRSVYLDDIPVLKNTLHGIVFCSPEAHATVTGLDVSRAQLLPGVERIFTWKDIPGTNEIGGIIADEPLFAAGEVHYQGQPLALIVASDEHTAIQARDLIEFEASAMDVITDPREAFRKSHLLIPSRTFRKGDPSAVWTECDHIFEGTASTGGQEHLYLETQGAYAYPGENGSVKIHSSTQGPTLVQKIAARVLGISMNHIEVDVTRLGGAFGGKEDQATATAVMAALASYLLHRPVKITLSRTDDIRMTGKRHPYSSDYRIGLTKDYKIKAYSAVMFQNGGAAADLSPAIMERTLFHSTNAYNIPNSEVTVHSCRTNLPPNTAFRGFGAPQGMFLIEAAIARAADELGVPAHVIQKANLLRENDEFQYGQIAAGVNISRCYEELYKKFDIAGIEKEISDFNNSNTSFRRGMALMPICFGLSFTNTSMNQARALVHIYQDGSIGISTGAVEMGQGVNTKLAQVAARVFSVDIRRVKMESTNTARVANTSPTAASSGADLNGNALLVACTELLERLKVTASLIHNCSNGEIEIRDERVVKNGTVTETTWEKLVQKAFLMRVSLTGNGHYSTPHIFFDKSTEKGHPFAYHIYGTAAVTVTLDCLRGTYKIDDVLIIHDFGNSLNPVIDKGQVDGGVMQGIGWMTMEEVAFDDTGRLLSGSLSTYKIPDIYSAPGRIVCHALETSGPDLAIFRSKAVGEPPFMYGIGAYFALRNAIKAFRPGIKTDFDAPMTPEKVLMRLYNR